MEIVNIYPGGPDRGWKLVCVHPDGTESLVSCTYDFFIQTSPSVFDRIQCRTWKTRDERVKKESRPTFEADLNPVRRYLADNPHIQIAKPRRAFTDLECDPTPGFENKHLSRVLVASVKGFDGKEFLGVLDSFDDDGERALLKRYFDFLKQYDQIIAWNGGGSFGPDGYDFPVLRARVTHLWGADVARRMNRWLWLDHLKAYRKLYLMFAESGEERSSFSLESVSQFVLHKGKIEYDARRCLIDWEAGGKARDDLALYCAQDTALLPEIEAETGILDIAHQVANICGCLHDSGGLHATTFVDGFLLRLAGQRGIRLPTKPHVPDGAAKKNFAGAYVFPPTARGIEKNVFSVDFNSLYPSIYIMLNASPETKGLDGCVSPETGIQFAQDPEGVFPIMCATLGKLKKHWKNTYNSFAKGTDEYKKAKSTHDGVKSIINSIYGYGGSIYARTFDVDIAGSITLTGQYLIKAVATEIVKKGWRIVQGDTDSCYISGCTREELLAFIDWCNSEFLPEIARKHGCTRSAPNLAFDTAYERMVVSLKANGEDVAKKKYVARFADATGDAAKFEVKGLEWKRGDSSPLARELQEKVCRMLMEDLCEDPNVFADVMHAFRLKVISPLETKLSLKEVVLSVGLGKDLEEYDSNTPGITAAKILKERGADVRKGSKIKFIVTDGTCSPVKAIPAEDYDGTNVDRNYLWENKVAQPTVSVLNNAFPDFDWDKFIKISKYEKREQAGQGRLPGV